MFDDLPDQHRKSHKKMSKERALRMKLAKALAEAKEGPNAMCDNCSMVFAPWFVKDTIVGFKQLELCECCRKPSDWIGIATMEMTKGI